MNRLAISLVSVALCVGAVACGGDDGVAVGDNGSELQAGRPKDSVGDATGSTNKVPSCWLGSTDPGSATATTFNVGDAVPSADGCNTCVCTKAGIVCTAQVCPAPVCKYNGRGYQAGETFPDVNGCDTCSCGKDGNVSCTDRACATPVCKFNGKAYAVGQQYPDADCCNICTCQADGTSACGGRLCGPAGGNLCK